MRQMSPAVRIVEQYTITPTTTSAPRHKGTLGVLEWETSHSETEKRYTPKPPALETAAASFGTPTLLSHPLTTFFRSG